MDKFKEGDLVTHVTRPFTKMVIIKIKEPTQFDSGKAIACRWFEEATHCFCEDNFRYYELEGFPSER